MSPAPRSAIPITVENAMKGCAIAATSSVRAPSVTIAGSSVKIEASARGMSANPIPNTVSSAVASPAASQPADAASPARRCPSFCATIAPAATPSPSAERKLIASMLMSPWFAAIAAAPRRPMIATKAT